MSNKPPVGANADPNGDVELLVGGEGNITTIKVASKVLSSASPVFAALFEPHFSEGLALSKSSTSSICQIKLPDDNPEALTLVCHVLHYRRDIPHRISLELLEKVAILCDKYDLAIVLMPWSEVWLHQIDGQGEASWAIMLCIASIFGNHRAFNLSSLKLLSSCVNQPLPKKRKRVTADGKTDLHTYPPILSGITTQAIYKVASLPDRLFAGIHHNQESIRLGTQMAIEDIMGQAMKDEENDNDALTIYHLLDKLKMIKLWPFSTKFQSLTIQDITEMLQNLDPCPGTCGCTCESYRIKEGLVAAVNDVEAKLKGLCLECVRHGRVLFLEGNCAAEFPIICSQKSSDGGQQGQV